MKVWQKFSSRLEGLTYRQTEFGIQIPSVLVCPIRLHLFMFYVHMKCWSTLYGGRNRPGILLLSATNRVQHEITQTEIIKLSQEPRMLRGLNQTNANRVY